MRQEADDIRARRMEVFRSECAQVGDWNRPRETSSLTFVAVDAFAYLILKSMCYLRSIVDQIETMEKSDLVSRDVHIHVYFFQLRPVLAFNATPTPLGRWGPRIKKSHFNTFLQSRATMTETIKIRTIVAKVSAPEAECSL